MTVDRNASDERTNRPLRERPGRPIASGFTLLPDDEQEAWRESNREMQRRLLPWIEEADLCRARAQAAARSAFIR